ncbi:MAG TPA: hypothetical protein VFV08_10875, partial [Puia sp.]|nr:hypothetical protein [Puia sp.]
MVGFGGMISFGFTFGGNTGGGGGTVNAADNGLSLETASTVRLGQAVGTPGDPAILAGNAEIPLGGFSFNFIDKNVNAQFLIGLAQTNGINFFYDSNLQGAFMAFNFADLFTGAGFAFSNDAAANITFVNQTDTVMLFTPAANIQAGVAGTTRSITLFGANDTSVQPNLVVLQNGQISLTGNSDDTVPAKLNFI